MSLSDIASRANNAIIDNFANADVLVDGHDPVRGIFERPNAISTLDGGGHVDSEQASVIVKSSEGIHLERRVPVTVITDKGKTLTYQVVLPDDDGFGRLKLSLGQSDVGHTTASQPHTSSILY